MADNSLTMTAAELRRIGQGIANLPPKSKNNAIIRDLIAVHAALERLIERHLYGDFATQQIKDKDAAIDALLGANP